MGADLVLLVEDSAADVEAVRRALRRTHPDVEVEHLPTADGLVARLLDRASLSPSMVLLDLNLPGLDGRRALGDVRQQPQLADVPVVVLTSSTNPRDVDSAYAAGASGYLFKPVSFALLEQSLARTVSYWLDRQAGSES